MKFKYERSNVVEPRKDKNTIAGISMNLFEPIQVCKDVKIHRAPLLMIYIC